MLDLVLVIVAGLAGAVVARMLNQPLILGYILAGVLVGPHTGGTTVDIANVEKLADIGVALLLFSLGLEFSKKDIRSISGLAVYGTLIQVGLTVTCGYFIGQYVGWGLHSSLWFGLAIASSSTAVIMKTLVSRGNMNTLSGKLMMGMSIVQDVTLIPLMILLLQFGKEGEFSWASAAMPIGMAVAFVAVMHIFGAMVAPLLLRWIARWNSRELFSLCIVAIGLGVGGISYWMGLSFAFGAFVAGLVLSDSDYGHSALSELVPVRDIFGLLFFVSIGMLLDVRFLYDHLGMVLFLFAAATFSRGLILSAMSWLFGYRRVIPIAMFFGMLAISEIAFVLIRMGLEEGVISGEVYSLILNTVVVSMVVGPIASGLTTPVYDFIKRHSRLDGKVRNMSLPEDSLSKHIIVVGDNGASRDIGIVLNRLSLPYVIIESNHKVYRQLKHLNLNVIYGDPASETILTGAGISRCRVLLLMMKDEQTRDSIIRHVRHIPSVQIIVQAETIEEMVHLRDKDEVDVIHPDFEAAFEVARQTLLHLGVPAEEIHGYLYRARNELYEAPAGRHKGGRAEDLTRLLNQAQQRLTSAWVQIPQDANLIGKTLSEAQVRTLYGITITGVMRGEEFTPNPPADFRLQEKDFVAVMGHPEQCQKWIQDMKPKNVEENNERPDPK
ncbi:MAG: cation:proton antiporter [Verrucomicrobia bacterium]|nr:cation:proton antiporter [Verrucomicrobiota bacterium]